MVACKALRYCGVISYILRKLISHRVKAYSVSSDLRWKTHVKALEHPLRKILNMTGVSYKYRSKQFPEKNFQEGVHLGFIAQHIEPIVPEIVRTDAAGWKSVQYSAVVPVIVEAMKEQQDQMQKQQEDIRHLSAQLQQHRHEISTLVSLHDQLLSSHQFTLLSLAAWRSGRA